MTLEASGLYAVVWHSSGRVDFEPMENMCAKNAADLEAGRPITRALIGVEVTEMQAGHAAKNFRSALKNLKTEDWIKMTTKATAEQVAVALPHWYYVEWSPKGAIRAVPVEDAHFRNHCAFKRRESVGYEPVGLCPSLDAALDFIIDLKRMKKELWHDEAGVRGGDEGAGVGGSGDGTEHTGLRTARAGNVGPGGSGEGEAERLDQDHGVADGTTEGPGVTCG